MVSIKYLGIPLDFINKSEILEHIEKDIVGRRSFSHIISINAENIVSALKNEEFKRVVTAAHYHICDGAWVALSAQILYGLHLPRLTGVDTMDSLIEEASKRRLRVLLIGGKGNLAEKVLDCYRKRFRSLEIFQTNGFIDIRKPSQDEEKEIFRIVRTTKPHFVFVSFGSPWQEVWIERHRNLFGNCLIMGVGGAFGYLSATTPRAPYIIRKLGFEWLFRLVIEPWRIRRQMRLFIFVKLILEEKLKQWNFK